MAPGPRPGGTRRREKGVGSTWHAGMRAERRRVTGASEENRDLATNWAAAEPSAKRHDVRVQGIKRRTPALVATPGRHRQDASTWFLEVSVGPSFSRFAGYGRPPNGKRPPPAAAPGWEAAAQWEAARMGGGAAPIGGGRPLPRRPAKDTAESSSKQLAMVAVRAGLASIGADR
mmetsp:Transcript_60730/g.162305  ORF Transcript_60730/g.162305 Transcript_60730/m.162305 type:complete len:174 (+) Transcript_60730:927-1448(+)